MLGALKDFDDFPKDKKWHIRAMKKLLEVKPK